MESEEDRVLPESKKRKLKTPLQLEGLENFYSEHKYPSESLKLKIALELGLSERQVQGWFCHRRLKDKKLMKEENVIKTKLSPSSGNGAPNLPNGGFKQESSSSGKTGEQQSPLNHKDIERQQRMVNPTDYASAVLASETQDHELLRANVDFKEEMLPGSSTVSQERSPLQSVRPYKSEMAKQSVPKSNFCEPELKRGVGINNKILRSDEYEEHRVIRIVKEELGAEYREDGPVLGIVFDSLPPGAFRDLNEKQDLGGYQDMQKLPTKIREEEYGKSYVMDGFSRGRLNHVPFTPSRRLDQGYMMPEKTSPMQERTSSFIYDSLNNKYSGWQPSKHHRSPDTYHVPDLNSSMQLDEDCRSGSPSSLYFKKARSSWHSSEASGKQSPSSQLPFYYGSKNGIISSKVQNGCREFPFSHLNGSVDAYSGAAGASLNEKLPSHMIPSSGLHSSQDFIHAKKLGKRERAREERKVERDHQQFLRLKQKYNAKEEKMDLYPKA